MQRIRLTQNDNDVKFIFNIKKDGIVETILGATIEFQLEGSESGRKICRECEITDANSGECMYSFTTEDLSVPDTYMSEIQITYSNGTKLTHRNPVVVIVIPEVVICN